MSMQPLIKAALAADAPLLLWGPPGVGKTAVIEALAAQTGAHLVTLIGSQLDPTDVGGLLMPDLAAARVQTLAPDWAVSLAEAASKGQPAWLFLDELSCAPRAVQAALLHVVQSRVVARVSLAKVRIVAAANPPELAADGWALSAATANRWVHLPWVVDLGAWCEGMRAGWCQDQSPAVAASRALIARYVASSMTPKTSKEDVPPLLVVPTNPEAQGSAWPSPRSWDAAARLLASLAEPPSSDSAHVLVAGAVGRAQAIGLLTWLTEAHLPDPEALLAAPLEHKLPQRVDQLSATVEAACSAACAKHKGRRARVAAAWQLLTRIPKDVAVPAGGTLCRARLAHKELQVDKLPPLGLELDKVLRAASEGLEV